MQGRLQSPNQLRKTNSFLLALDIHLQASKHSRVPMGNSRHTDNLFNHPMVSSHSHPMDSDLRIHHTQRRNSLVLTARPLPTQL